MKHVVQATTLLDDWKRAEMNIQDRRELDSKQLKAVHSNIVELKDYKHQLEQLVNSRMKADGSYRAKI